VTGRIRRASEADVGRILPVARACFEPAWSEAALAAALRVREGRGWLALRAEEPAAPVEGFVLARRIADLLEVDLVGVDPAARRRGIAARLLGALIEAERGAGLVEARLELSAANHAAAALYAGLGFVVVGRRPRYYPDGSEALLLARAFA